MLRQWAAGCAAVVLLASAVQADEIIFNNGDRLTGKIVGVEGGKMKITTKVAGDVTVDTKDIKTFSTEAPVEVRTKEGAKITAPAKADQAGTVSMAPAGGAPAKTIKVEDMKYVNFSEAWSGAVIAGGIFTRGNTYSDQANIAFDLGRRTEQDRWTIGAGYNFGRQRDATTGNKSTTTDNWFATAKYDYFLNEKLYAFGSIRYEHDRIANLDYRLVPGFGLGYQWIDKPDLKFDTEAGLAYVCEKFSDDTNNGFISARFAYHAKKNCWGDKVQLFHNLEYYPSLETLSDYLIVTDAGIRTAITEKMFAEYKIEYRYDAIPAQGSSRSDLRHIVGLGWKF